MHILLPGNHASATRNLTARAASYGSRKTWLVVNGDANANNAVAIDASGYHGITGTWTGVYDIVRLGGLP